MCLIWDPISLIEYLCVCVCEIDMADWHANGPSKLSIKSFYIEVTSSSSVYTYYIAYTI